MKYKVIGITGTRGVGKDTLFRLLNELDPRFTRFAFADKLKSDLFQLVFTQFGYDMNHLTSEQKEVVRHLLIGYGMSWRAADPLHWVKEVADQINTKNLEVIPFITDFRFENEVKYFQERYGNEFFLINLKRQNGPEPTEEEKRNFEKVEKMANWALMWGDNTEKEQLLIAKLVLDYLVK